MLSFLRARKCHLIWGKRGKVLQRRRWLNWVLRTWGHGAGFRGDSKVDCVHACSVTQLCLTVCIAMDCSPPGSSADGISQARTLEWVAISFSRGSSRPRDRTRIFFSSCIGQILYHLTTWEALGLGCKELHMPYLRGCIIPRATGSQ